MKAKLFKLITQKIWFQIKFELCHLMPKLCKRLKNKLKDFDFLSFKAPIVRNPIMPFMAQLMTVPKLQMRHN